MMMREQHRTYIEEIKQDIRVFEGLVRRAKERSDDVDIWAKPEWSNEIHFCESRLTVFREMLQIAEENFAKQ